MAGRMPARLNLKAVLAPFLLVGAVLGTACGNDGGSIQATADGDGARISGKVTVFAAASLTDAFREIAAGFEKSNRGVDVVFNFAGTPTLRTQLEQGARADI